MPLRHYQTRPLTQTTGTGTFWNLQPGRLPYPEQRAPATLYLTYDPRECSTQDFSLENIPSTDRTSQPLTSKKPLSSQQPRKEILREDTDIRKSSMPVSTIVKGSEFSGCWRFPSLHPQAPVMMRKMSKPPLWEPRDHPMKKAMFF